MSSKKSAEIFPILELRSKDSIVIIQVGQLFFLFKIVLKSCHSLGRKNFYQVFSVIITQKPFCIAERNQRKSLLAEDSKK
jgi:hypothetical protein